ncbi:helix-turn-helix domain-containing protein [Mariprofundus ferrooxydans]|nr:helix-turn-helix domain-containing protein [Mariprofundus ferrooxydans]
MNRSTDEPALLEFMIHPPAGWIRHKRDKLGITGSQLASKIGVSKQRISALEKAELSGAASLKSMRQAASALGCDFVYALIPKHSLQQSQHAAEFHILDSLQRLQAPQGKMQIAELCKQFHIKHLGLYGPAARGEFDDDNGIHLLAEFSAPEKTTNHSIEDIEIQFGRLFGRKATLVNPSILDDPHQVDAIMADLKLLYVS